MASKSADRASHTNEITALKARAEKAEEMLRAIRSGEVDALVVEGADGRQVFTLKGADHNYRVLMDNINEGALTLSKNGMILFCNRQFGEMVKSPLEHIISKNIRDYIQPEFQNALDSLLANASTATLKTELVLAAKDNARIPAAISLTTLPASEDHDLCMAVTNLQQRHEAAAELKEKQEELNQSRKLEAIGRLAGGVAHDFNNLLTGIVGIAQDVKESFPSWDPRKADLEDVVRASDRAFALTKQLLAFGRRQTMVLKDIDMHMLIANTTALLRRLIREDIELKYRLAASNPWVRSDATYLEQILVNLCLNARDAMPKGGEIRIETSTLEVGKDFTQWYPRLAPGNYLMLEVNDPGIGMSQETLSRIFEPYFTTKKDHGTGLGLATVYGLVKQTGGDIAVFSEMGVGSSFKVYLPQAQGVPQPDVEKVMDLTAGGNETVLVVEDEEVVRRVVVLKLKKKGISGS